MLDCKHRCSPAPRGRMKRDAPLLGLLCETLTYRNSPIKSSCQFCACARDETRRLPERPAFWQNEAKQ
jgi:hypothetical protein